MSSPPSNTNACNASPALRLPAAAFNFQRQSGANIFSKARSGKTSNSSRDITAAFPGIPQQVFSGQVFQGVRSSALSFNVRAQIVRISSTRYLSFGISRRSETVGHSSVARIECGCGLGCDLSLFLQSDMGRGQSGNRKGLQFHSFGKKKASGINLNVPCMCPSPMLVLLGKKNNLSTRADTPVYHCSIPRCTVGKVLSRLSSMAQRAISAHHLVPLAPLVFLIFLFVCFRFPQQHSETSSTSTQHSIVVDEAEEQEQDGKAKSENKKMLDNCVKIVCVPNPEQERLFACLAHMSLSLSNTLTEQFSENSVIDHVLRQTSLTPSYDNMKLASVATKSAERRPVKRKSGAGFVVKSKAFQASAQEQSVFQSISDKKRQRKW